MESQPKTDGVPASAVESYVARAGYATRSDPLVRAL
jgi:hypothetical protein